MRIIAWLRRWWAVFYGASFMAVLAYTSVVAVSINEEAWMTLFRRSSWRWESTYPAVFLQAMGVVALMGVLSHLLQRVDRNFDARGLVRANVNFRPLYHRVWRWPFMVLMLWNLPLLAMLEEFIFRHGGLGWSGPIETSADVLIRTLAFGAFHGLMTWNWRGGIMQSTLGFWFSYEYLAALTDKLGAASTAHFLVDLLILAPVFLAVALNGKKTLEPKTPACS